MSRAALVLVLLLVVLVAGCGADDAQEAASAPEATPDEPTEPRDPQDAEAGDGGDDHPGGHDVAGAAGVGLTAVSSVFPLAWMAAAVAPGADVTFLGAGGADPHDLELSPGDRALLETADVVLYMGGLDFQPQVERAVADAGGEVVDVRAIVGDAALIERGEHDDDDDHNHNDDDRNDDDHAHGLYDPHLWFDPSLMAAVAPEIPAAFAAADPDRAEDYAANAEALQAELLALDDELDALLSECRFDTAIVSHEAYGYLLEPRDLGQEGISGAGGHAEASPQRIAELSAQIRDQGIPAVLAEPLHGRDDAEALAAESGAELLTIDPLEIASDEHFERGYPALLREQAEQFATALDCQGAT